MPHLNYEEFLNIDIRIRKAIVRAIENDPSWLETFFEKEAISYILEKEEEHHGPMWVGMLVKHILEQDVMVIWSKGFAKAFWGDEDDVHIDYSDYRQHLKTDIVRSWQAQQIQMILADDPLGYLDGYIGKEQS